MRGQVKFEILTSESEFKYPLSIISSDDNNASFNLHFSFINGIRLLSTAQCGLPMAPCDDWRLWIFTVLIFLKGMWEGYEIQPAHRPFINTRRDSQAVMQDISHPGMLHFVSLFSHSPFEIFRYYFFILWDGGGADLFFKRMLFWVSGG